MQASINAIKEKKAALYNQIHYKGKVALRYFGRSIPMFLPALLTCFLAPSNLVLAQITPSTTAAPTQNNPLSTFNKLGYGLMKNTLLRSAEKMPEEHYSFRPTDAVRTYGQIIGHIADGQYTFCSVVLGEKNPALILQVEKTKTSKADLIAALKESFSYCDKAYDGMTDAAATQTVKYSGFDVPKLFVLIGNKQHNSLHYGNLVTYMRLKNIVPPTSEPGFIPQKKE